MDSKRVSPDDPKRQKSFLTLDKETVDAYNSETTLFDLFDVSLADFKLVEKEMIEGLAYVKDSDMHREAYIVYWILRSWSRADGYMWTGADAEESEALTKLWGSKPASEATLTEGYEALVANLDQVYKDDPSKLQTAPDPTEDQLAKIDEYVKSVSSRIGMHDQTEVHSSTQPTGMRYPETDTTGYRVRAEIKRQRRAMMASMVNTFYNREAWYTSFGGIIGALGFCGQLARMFGATAPSDVLYALSSLGSIMLSIRAILNSRAESVGQLLGSVSIAVLMTYMDYQRLRNTYMSLFKERANWENLRSQVRSSSLESAPETYSIIGDRMRSAGLDPRDKNQLAQFMYENAAEFQDFAPHNANQIRACKRADPGGWRSWFGWTSERCLNVESAQNFYELALQRMRTGGIPEISDFRERIVRRLWEGRLTDGLTAASWGSAFFGPWVGGGVVLAYIMRQQWLRAVEVSHEYIGSFFPTTLRNGAPNNRTATGMYNDAKEAIDQVANMVVLRCIRMDPFDEAEDNGRALRRGLYYSNDLRKQNLPVSPMIDANVMAHPPANEMPVMDGLNPAQHFRYYEEQGNANGITQIVKDYIKDDRKRSIKKLNFARADFNYWYGQLSNTLNNAKSPNPILHAEQIGQQVEKWNALIKRCYDDRYVKLGIEWRRDVVMHINSFDGIQRNGVVRPDVDPDVRVGALAQPETQVRRPLPPLGQRTTPDGNLLGIAGPQGAMPAGPAQGDMDEDEIQDFRWLMDPSFMASLSETSPPSHISTVDTVFAKLGLS